MQQVKEDATGSYMDTKRHTSLFDLHDVGIAEDTYYKWINVFCNVWVRTYRYFTIACLNRDLYKVYLDTICVFDIAKNEIFC